MYQFVSHVRPGGKTKSGARDLSAHLKTEPLTAALADFQKALCFFILAISIAAQLIERNGGFAPVSLQQLYYDYTLLDSIAISGYLPITATLITLHMIDMMSCYLLFLSACTVGLSLFTSTRIAHGNITTTSADQAGLLAENTGGPRNCGGHNLTVYCLQPPPNDNIFNTNQQGTNFIVITCLIVLGGIILEQLLKIWARELKESKTATSRGDGKTHWERPLKSIVYVTCFSFYVYAFLTFFQDLLWFQNLVDRTAWSFGQIVAINVWAPPLFEYFHLEMRT